MKANNKQKRFQTARQEAVKSAKVFLAGAYEAGLMGDEVDFNEVIDNIKKDDPNMNPLAEIVLENLKVKAVQCYEQGRANSGKGRFY